MKPLDRDCTAASAEIIRRLDARLNVRIITARPGRQLNHRLREKLRIKRRFDHLTGAALETAAREALASVEREARQ